MAASSVRNTSGVRHSVGSPWPAALSQVWTMTMKPAASGSKRMPPFIRIPSLRPCNADEPLAPQHCVYCRPDPHGQGALRSTSLMRFPYQATADDEALPLEVVELQAASRS